MPPPHPTTPTLISFHSFSRKLSAHTLFLSPADFLREDTLVGTSFLRVAAHDDDFGTNAAITYSMSLEQPEYLQVNPVTGWVYVNQPISQVGQQLLAGSQSANTHMHTQILCHVAARGFVSTKLMNVSPHRTSIYFSQSGVCAVPNVLHMEREKEDRVRLMQAKQIIY